jgi:hypothetical protein
MTCLSREIPGGDSADRNCGTYELKTLTVSIVSRRMRMGLGRNEMAELSEADKKTILGAAYEPPKAKSPGAPAKRTWSERLRGLLRRA